MKGSVRLINLGDRTCMFRDGLDFEFRDFRDDFNVLNAAQASTVRRPPDLAAVMDAAQHSHN